MKIAKSTIKKVIREQLLFSEGMRYHIFENSPLSESVYRPGSKAFFDLVNEARARFYAGEIKLCEEDIFLVESDLGEFDMYQGREVALDYPISVEADELMEAEYRGKKVDLNKPKRGGPKKFYVYVRDPKTKNVRRVTFGQKGMTTKLRDPARRKSFIARHKCKTTTDKTKPSYWSCRIGRYPKITGAPYVTWW